MYIGSHFIYVFRLIDNYKIYFYSASVFFVLLVQPITFFVINILVFQEEVKNIQQFHHLNIMYAQSIMTSNNYICFMMPLMVHKSCDLILQNTYPGGLPEIAIAIIVKDVLNAISYLHSKRIVHG